MNYLPLLTEDEAQYICSSIPYEHTISYFRQHPKEFAKIRPGFRPQSISRSDASKLLYNHRSRPFVSRFIEDHISDWLSQIQQHFNKCIEDGESKEFALIHTLPFSYFSGNVALYFKLIKEEYPEDYVALFTTTVTAIKEATEEQDKLQADLIAKKLDIKQLQTDLELAKIKLQKAEAKRKKQSTMIKTLKRSITDLEKFRAIVQNREDVIASLKAKIQEKERTIQDLRAEISNAKDNIQQLEVRIRTKLENKKTIKVVNQQFERKPKCPKDFEEFKEYLGYNLENIGIPANSEYCVLLKEHLSKILFQGIPVVVNRSVGKTLMKCVANTLSGQSNVSTQIFNEDLSVNDIDCFLSSSERVVNLDNFLGNCNETELLPLFDNHRDKIIFLTVAYDRTLNYVSKEFMRYCHYLNLNRIAVLSANAELTEDPSNIDETAFERHVLSQDNPYSSLLREMLAELGFLQCLIEQKCATISDEQDLCRVLAFDVLPYCVDVLRISPYNSSERLLKYAGNGGRCPYKNLLKGWFAR